MVIRLIITRCDDLNILNIHQEITYTIVINVMFTLDFTVINKIPVQKHTEIIFILRSHMYIQVDTNTYTISQKAQPDVLIQ